MIVKERKKYLVLKKLKKKQCGGCMQLKNKKRKERKKEKNACLFQNGEFILK